MSRGSGPDAAARARDAAARARDAAERARATAARARIAAARADRLAASRVASAARLRANESREAERAARIEALDQDRRATEARIAALNASLAAMIPAFRGLARAPASGVFIGPGTPAENAAALLALRGMATGIAADLAALRASRAKASALASSLTDQRSRLATLHAREVAREASIESGVRLAQQAEAEAAREQAASSREAAAAAAEAASLADAVASLEASRNRRQAQGTNIAASTGDGVGRGAVTPVAGPIVRAFGSATDTGRASGVSYGPPPSALVSSPCRGTIDFAASFRSYGKTVIVDCGRSWRFVLAGLATIDAVPGGRVRAGEPIGRMPDYTPGSKEGRPTLYLQLRHGDDAVDPRTYLR